MRSLLFHDFFWGPREDVPPPKTPFLMSCHPFMVTIKKNLLQIGICANTDSRLKKLYQMYDPYQG
jgi:hypothetical protein